ncbi:MAG: DUF3817 domain-containing protein [Flavobacteriales bacterium]
MNAYRNLQWLFRIGFWEGISYLILLGVAMPLKYYGGMPKAVSYTGMAHGVLFIVFVMLIVQAQSNEQISRKQALQLGLASIVPFGTFFLERIVLKKS